MRKQIVGKGEVKASLFLQFNYGDIQVYRKVYMVVQCTPICSSPGCTHWKYSAILPLSMIKNENINTDIDFKSFKIYCGKIYRTQNLLSYPFLGVQFSGLKYVHIIMQPSPPSISRTFYLSKLQLYAH